MVRLVIAVIVVCSWASPAEWVAAAQPVAPEVITTPRDVLKPDSKPWLPSHDTQTVEQKIASDEADEYRHSHEKKKKDDEDDHLIPYKYKKYFAAGLHRPWTFLPDYKYWYGPKYHPWNPGVRTIYRPSTKNLNYVDYDPTVHRVSAPLSNPHVGATSNGTTVTSGMHTQLAQSAGAAYVPNMNPAMTSDPQSNSASMQMPPQPAYQPNVIQNPWQGAYNAGYAPPPQMMPGMMGQPNSCNCQAGMGMPQPPMMAGYNVGGPVYSASYWPRHAGSYSPFVGYYGYGGRYHYGYGPYNYNWNQGIRYAGYGWAAGPGGAASYGYAPNYNGYNDPYGNNAPGYGYGVGGAGGGVSRFGRDGTFNYGYWQSGLAY